MTFLSSHIRWKGFGGRGVLPGVATGSGVGPQTGEFIGSMLLNCGKSHGGSQTCLKTKIFSPYSSQELEYLHRVVLDQEEQAVSVIRAKVTHRLLYFQ